MILRYLSVCSGLEGATLAWHSLGWVPVGFAEIEKFPAAIVAHHYGSNMPGAPLSRNAPPNFGDFTQINASALGTVDILVGGTPCFGAGTTILCKRGFLQIECVRVGDEVWTHSGRWRPVTAVMSRIAETVIVKGQGHWGITTTAEHPFLSRAVNREWNIGSKKSGETAWQKTQDDPRWTAATEMWGRYWAAPINIGALPVPVFEIRAYEGRNLPHGLDENFFWFVGAWVGDGWIRYGSRSERPDGQTHGVVYLCGNKKHEKAIAERLTRAGLAFSVSQERTTVRFQISSKPVARWLNAEFGRGCEGKKIPTWLIGQPESIRRAFFEGYLFADGHTSRQKGGGIVRTITTINPRLAIGARMIANSLGYGVCIGRSAPKRSSAIEGRKVSEKPFYQVRIFASSRSAFPDGGFMWGKVRSVAPGRPANVFNIEVADDNSYVADGLVVHNCQSFSVAGARHSLADARGNLSLAFTVLAYELARSNGLRNAVWENVQGVLSTPDNAFGCFLGALVGSDDALLLPRGIKRWPDAGMVSGPRARAAWRILDAQYVGLAQRRKRVFLVADFGKGADPAQVLFERQSLQGNPPPRREKGERVAPTISARTKGGGGLGTDFDLDGGLIAHSLRAGGFDASDSKDHGAAAHDESHANGGGQLAVAFDMRGREGGAQFEGPHNTANIRAASGGSSRSYIATQWAVRRLMPVECEKLQGIPPGYTAIPWRGKPASECPDGPRYRAIGNSWAVPILAWIGERIDGALEARQ